MTAFPSPTLPGAHQYINAATAVIAARRLPLRGLTDAVLAKGLTTARWPGRMQDLTKTALGARLPEGWSLWLDGGHNAAAAEALAAIAQDWSDAPLYVVFGALASRDPTDFLRPLAPYIAGLQAISIPGEETTLSAGDACAAARAVGMEADTAPSITGALDAIIKVPARPGRILICGSLYLAGAVLAELEKETPLKSGAS